MGKQANAAVRALSVRGQQLYNTLPLSLAKFHICFCVTSNPWVKDKGLSRITNVSERESKVQEVKVSFQHGRMATVGSSMVSTAEGSLGVI